MFLKLYKPRNIVSTVVHYGAAAGLLTCSIALGSQPWFLAAAVVYTVVNLVRTGMEAGGYLSRNLVRLPEQSTDSPHLGAMAMDLAKKAGFEVKQSPLYCLRHEDFPARSGFLANKSDAVRRLELMGKTFNAAASSRRGAPFVIVSPELLKLLDEEEQKAVLAHEFTHLAARHSGIGGVHRVACKVTSTVNFLSQAAAALTTGLPALLVAGAAWSAAKVSFLVSRKNRNLVFAEQSKMTPQMLHHRLTLENRQRVAANVAGVAALAFYSPAFLMVFAAAQGLSVTCQLLGKAFLRSCEYQADRGAVALGADPLALAKALRKLDAGARQSLQSALGGKLPAPGQLSYAWQKVVSTHPPVESRISRLCRMAKEQGRSVEEIREAARGLISIPAKFELPPDVVCDAMRVKQKQMRLSSC